jgi:hypothetical protein
LSALEKVLRLAAPEGGPADDAEELVRAAAERLNELVLLLADTDDDGDGDDEDDDEDEDDAKGGKKKPPWLGKKKAKGAKADQDAGKKKVKASALVQEAMVALSALQGGELLLSRVPAREAAESDSETFMRLAGKAPASQAVAMEHGRFNGTHSHPHRVIRVEDGDHHHNNDSNHTTGGDRDW